MKYRMRVKNANSEWWENYDDHQVNSLDDAVRIGRGHIESYNASLNPREIPREFIEAELVGASTAHKWEKQNSFTIMDRSGAYDLMRCAKCGCTARRYGLSPNLQRETKYRAKKWELCQPVSP